MKLFKSIMLTVALGVCGVSTQAQVEPQQTAQQELIDLYFAAARTGNSEVINEFLKHGFPVDIKNGLNNEQVELRKKQGLANVTRKKTGKSYFAIFMGNIFTFFNLLGIIIMILMLAVGSWSNMFFFIVILSNTVNNTFESCV